MIQTTAWEKLLQHHSRIDGVTMRQHFAADRQRFEHLSASACGLVLDYSKNRVVAETIDLLVELARQRGVEAARDAMFAGATVNRSEGRAALHTALRASDATPLAVAGQDVRASVRSMLARMGHFVKAVRAGDWRGHDGQAIRTVVHLGIGGSDLGPRLACAALSPYGRTELTVRFVANVDAHELDATLADLDAATTLFIIASKSFTTAETMMNANAARDWCRAQGVAEAALARHFVAVSSNAAAVRAFGIDAEQMFPMYEWVGGRFSLWSAIGLPIALQSGMDVFLELHAGARAMDQHFQSAPLACNLPVLLALIGIWNVNVLDNPSLSVAPYHHLLAGLPAYLQQLEMESNGKSISQEGTALRYRTAPIVWGQAGTSGQHAYFQWLHQAVDWAPVDFIAVAQAEHKHPQHHAALLANCLAQSAALMRGKTPAEVEAELLTTGQTIDDARRLAPHMAFAGNRPSNTILMARLDAQHLGALLAMYEHKVTMQATIWGINPFDQWGVEWGKVLARDIAPGLTHTALDEHHDASTRGLAALMRKLREA